MNTRHSLEAVRKDPALRQSLQDTHVRIFSREHGAYWRPNGAGYTTLLDEAGKYTFDDAP